MKIDINKYSMGATAAIITSLGLIAGLAQNSGNRSGIIAGVLIIAIADNIADSLSVHIYKEAEGASRSEIYSTTIGNFIVRFFVAMTFVFIIMFLPSYTALIVSIVWGLLLLTVLSCHIAKARKMNPLKETAWHLLVALLVIGISTILGDIISGKIMQ